MDHSIIKINHVTKDFKGDGIVNKVLHDINLTLHQEQMTSIIGPSGSGKSTLLSLIGTLDKPSSGHIFFNDKDVAALKNKGLADVRFEEIGFIFQDYHLLPTLTAIENVMVPAFARKVSYKKKKRAEGLLEQVGLIEKKGLLPSQLSGGQQQRVAIARALFNEPSWILADEPTGNLDSANGDQIFDLIQRLHNDKYMGVVLVTHDMSIAKKTDRIIRLQDGVIASDLEGEYS